MQTDHSLELLNIMDIIKNEDIYRAKIDEINNKIQEFKDAKFIAATVEQANKLKAESQRVLSRAKEEVAKAQQVLDDKLDAEMKKLEAKMDQVDQRLKEVAAQEAKAQDWVNSFKAKDDAVNIQNTRNQQHADVLAKKEQALNNMEASLKQTKRELEEILRKL